MKVSRVFPIRTEYLPIDERELLEKYFSFKYPFSGLYVYNNDYSERISIDSNIVTKKSESYLQDMNLLLQHIAAMDKLENLTWILFESNIKSLYPEYKTIKKPQSIYDKK